MNTRELLIEAGLEALIAGGYDGMSIGPVLASAAVPKGSFYHFFKSKEAFAGAVLDAYADRYRQLRSERFADTSRTPLERLMSYFEALMQELTAGHPACGCLYGVLAQSMPSLGADLTQNLRSKFEAWESDLAIWVTEAQKSREIDPSLNPNEAARRLIDLYEGIALRARTTHTVPAPREFRAFATRALGAGAEAQCRSP